MSSTYYNNLWKEAINELLENIHEEFDPLDENLNEKGVLHHLFSSNMNARIRSGLDFTLISTSNTSTATKSWKTATTKWSIPKNACSSKTCWSQPWCGLSSSNSTSFATTPTPTPFAPSMSTWMSFCWKCVCAPPRYKCTSLVISSWIELKTK